MSQENVDVVRALLEAFNKGDVDAMLGLATDDVDVRPPSHLLDGIVFRGYAGTRAWMERAAETWRELEVVSAQLLGTAGEHVVMAQDVRSTGHGSGVPVEHRYIYAYTLRDGKVAAAIAYPGEAEALEAVGLRE
jgi:ketosteroid isomerase-like protein